MSTTNSKLTASERAEKTQAAAKQRVTERGKIQFTMSDEVRNLGVRGAYAVLTNLKNQKSHPEFELYRAELVKKLSQELDENFIGTDPVLEGFRQLHQAVGRSNRRYPASPESLISLFQRAHKIPAINLLVDIYNCISLETRLALGAHDIAHIEGNVTLRLTDGSEKFLPLGQSEVEPVGAREYCYIDDSNDVLCRLEFKQVEKTKVTEKTSACFFIIQGNKQTSREYLEQALKRLVELTTLYCGGEQQATWIEA